MHGKPLWYCPTHCCGKQLLLRKLIVNTPAESRLWHWHAAPDVRLRDRLAIAILVGAGIASVLRLGDWWFRPEHVGQPALFALLSLAFWYGVGRIVLGWINYLGIARPAHRDAPAGLSVSIFTTSAPGEPLGMLEKTLDACSRIHYPHRTYLLDDTGDPSFRTAAERRGAVWLDLGGLPDAKAGKINAALERTTGDFILVLDPDHIPFPEFLDRVLGHFADENVGFVQVAQAYYNQSRSFTAAAAAEQTYAFYGPGQMGLFGHGAAVAIGANCTFRREALLSIGGHGTGLAEDLVTAIRLHARKWKSVYVPEILSRGLVPEDLGSFYRQQLKWARGVHEVVFAEMPVLFGSLSWRQRLSYLAIGTYYLTGVTTLLYLAFPYLYLWTGLQPASMRFAEFLGAAAPVGAAGMLLYFFVQRWLCDRRSERGAHLRGLALKVACWPIYLAGTLLAVARADVPYVPTAKQAVSGRFFVLAAPSLLLMLLYALTAIRVLQTRMMTVTEGFLVLSSEAVWGMLAFATIPALMSAGALYAAWQSRATRAGSPWEGVDLDNIGGSAA